MRKPTSIFIVLLMLFGTILYGCTNNIKTESDKADFNSVLQNAKGTVVNIYGWGGSHQTNKWIDVNLSKYVKENYDITLKRVPMDIDQILNKILGEKQGNNEKGNIDIIWINGENFHSALKNDLLYGSFTQHIPNFGKYLDVQSRDVQYDFGYEIKGYEVPFGKSQFVFITDTEKVNEIPKNAEEFLEFAKNNKGKVTYPAPPDFIGSAFVRNIIFDIVGYDSVINAGNDKEKLKEIMRPAMDYFNELSQYLWKEGNTFPANIAQLDNMYADGEVVLTMSYNPNSIASMINLGRFKETSTSFIFEKGTIGNTHFLAIPWNSQNIDGALAVINATLSPEMQASKYDDKVWGDLPVVDYNKLNYDEKQLFDSISLGDGIIPQNELLEKRLSEPPADMVTTIEKLWEEEVLNSVK